MQPSSWRKFKSGCIMAKNEAENIWGVGHASFLTSVNNDSELRLQAVFYTDHTRLDLLSCHVAKVHKIAQPRGLDLPTYCKFLSLMMPHADYKVRPKV